MTNNESADHRLTRWHTVGGFLQILNCYLSCEYRFEGNSKQQLVIVCGIEIENQR